MPFFVRKLLDFFLSLTVKITPKVNNQSCKNRFCFYLRRRKCKFLKSNFVASFGLRNLFSFLGEEFFEGEYKLKKRAWSDVVATIELSVQPKTEPIRWQAFLICELWFKILRAPNFLTSKITVRMILKAKIL